MYCLKNEKTEILNFLETNLLFLKKSICLRVSKPAIDVRQSFTNNLQS